MSTSAARDLAGPSARLPLLAPPMLADRPPSPVDSSWIGEYDGIPEHTGQSNSGSNCGGRKRSRSTTALELSDEDDDDAAELRGDACLQANLVPLQALAGPSRSTPDVQLSELPSGVDSGGLWLKGVAGSGGLASRQPLPSGAMATVTSATGDRHKRRRSSTDSDDDAANENDEGVLSTRAWIASARSGSGVGAGRRLRPASAVEHRAMDDYEPMDVDLPIPTADLAYQSTMHDTGTSHRAHRSPTSSAVTSPARPAAPARVRSNGGMFSPTSGGPTAPLAFTTSVHASASAYRSRVPSDLSNASAATTASSATASSSALPLSMRRRPPLVRNTTAVPAPLTPAINNRNSGLPDEDGFSYFRPTPPASRGQAADWPDVTLRRYLEEASPTSVSSLAVDLRTHVSQALPRRPGAMDVSGRLRGSSRSANESWLGIRRSPSPPPAQPTLGLAAIATHGRFSPPVTPVARGGSGPSGRSSARAWAPIGGDDDGHLVRPLSPPGSTAQGVRERRSWLSDALAVESPSIASTSSTATTPGLRPFRLRPQAVRPLQPVTTSPISSTTARRTSLLAQLGSANEAEEALGSEYGPSVGFSRSRFDGLHGGTEARRRWTAGQASSPTHSGSTTASATATSALDLRPERNAESAPSQPQPFSAFRPFLLGGEGSREPAAPPMLSFLRPLQLPLSSTSSDAQAAQLAVRPSPASLTSYRSQLAPPVLTAAFSFGDDSDSESSASDTGDALPSGQGQHATTLTPQTRLPVMLASGMYAARGESDSPTGLSALPSFSSTHASDWSSSLPTPGGPGPVRRVPTLRPFRAADHGFGERSASSATSAIDTRPGSSSSPALAPFSAPSGSGAAHTSLSSDQASMSTASVGTGEQPIGAGSRLAEYLSRHSERRRRLLPGLVEAEEREAEGQGDDDWTGSLLDWFSARPNSSVDPAELQQAEVQLATRRRRLHELRRSRPLGEPRILATGREPSSNLAQTLDAHGSRSNSGNSLEPPAAPVPTSSVWDALLYPSPSTSVPRPLTAPSTSAPASRWNPISPAAAAAFEPGILAPANSREAILQELLRQISADLSSLSSRPVASSSTSPPFTFHHERSGLSRRRDGSGWTSMTSSGQQHPPPMPLGLSSLFSSLASPTSTALGTDFLTEDEIDFSYESLIELSARVPAVVRATPGWVVEGLPVRSYREQALKGVDEVDKRCAICLDDYVAHDLTMTSPCGHFLHEGCLKEWLCASHVCPLCRADVVPPSTGPSESTAGPFAIHVDGA